MSHVSILSFVESVNEQQNKAKIRVSLSSDCKRKRNHSVASPYFEVGGFKWSLRATQEYRNDWSCRVSCNLFCVGAPSVVGTEDDDWSCSVTSMTYRAVHLGNQNLRPLIAKPEDASEKPICLGPITTCWNKYTFGTFDGHIKDWNLAIELEFSVEDIKFRMVDLTNLDQVRQMRLNFLDGLRTVNTLMTNGEVPDFILQSSEGKEYIVHRSMLRERSRVFCTMLEQDFREAREGRVIIYGLSNVAFGLFVKFLVNRDISNEVNEAEVEILLELFEVGERYELKDLQWCVGDSLWRNCSRDTVIEIYSHMQLYSGVPEIVAKIENYVNIAFQKL